MTDFRLRWQKRGGHIHVRIFASAKENATHAQNGMLLFTEQEWESFLRCFQDKGTDRVVIVPEDGER